MAGEPVDEPMSMSSRASADPPLVEGRQGHYAGGVTRLLAFAADVGASWGLFTLGAAAIAFAIQLVTGHTYRLANHQLISAIALALWEFVYFAYQWSLAGRTIGMALLGIQVVKTDGTPIGVRQAVVRTLSCRSASCSSARPGRHPPHPRPACVSRPAGRDGGRLLVGRPGRPPALAGPAARPVGVTDRGGCRRPAARRSTCSQGHRSAPVQDPRGPGSRRRDG